MRSTNSVLHYVMFWMCCCAKEVEIDSTYSRGNIDIMIVLLLLLLSMEIERIFPWSHMCCNAFCHWMEISLQRTLIAFNFYSLPQFYSVKMLKECLKNTARVSLVCFPSHNLSRKPVNIQWNLFRRQLLLYQEECFIHLKYYS